MAQEERDELVLICSMMTNYAEEALMKLPDAELVSIYNKSMNAAIGV